jgi:hypothetical protein
LGHIKKVFLEVSRFGITAVKYRIRNEGLIMASFICKCGTRLSNTESLSKVELRVYTDTEWDEILKAIRLKRGGFPEQRMMLGDTPNVKEYMFFKTQSLSRHTSLNNREIFSGGQVYIFQRQNGERPGAIDMQGFHGFVIIDNE